MEIDVVGCFGWYNNELQYQARARRENAVVANGRLSITARLEQLSSAADWGGQRRASARLITRGKAAWTCGFFEVRAKLPCGRGTWPAIWTLGTGGVWPDDGEIGVMEQIGSNPTRVFGTSLRAERSPGSKRCASAAGASVRFLATGRSRSVPSRACRHFVR